MLLLALACSCPEKGTKEDFIVQLPLKNTITHMGYFAGYSVFFAPDRCTSSGAEAKKNYTQYDHHLSPTPDPNVRLTRQPKYHLQGIHEKVDSGEAPTVTQGHTNPQREG